MITSGHKTSIRLVSGSCWQRIGLRPLIFYLLLAGLVTVLWYGLSLWLVPYNPIWALATGSLATLFTLYLGWVICRLVRDAYKDYTLELNGTEIVLKSFDRLKKQTTVEMVLLDDVTYAEYYPYQDSGCIILHAPYVNLEVPLWPMGTRGQDVVDFLKGSGVTVVNVLSDEKIPECKNASGR